MRATPWLHPASHCPVCLPRQGREREGEVEVESGATTGVLDLTERESEEMERVANGGGEKES